MTWWPRWTARLLVGLLLVAQASAAAGPRPRRPVDELLWVWIEEAAGVGQWVDARLLRPPDADADAGADAGSAAAESGGDGGAVDAGIADAGRPAPPPGPPPRWTPWDGEALRESGATDLVELAVGERLALSLPRQTLMTVCDDYAVVTTSTEGEQVVITGLARGRTKCGFWFQAPQAWPDRLVEVRVGPREPPARP